ncbi:hypothetical protein BO70DRAFT_399627 [Aspergillus heteromorphus CBS 117.55]|uniref:Uncharacterized protein n=1 Tax=Aspergillus heteromorphus CBS 117.55 TaxID=1448321 RepID=A0A317V9F0_9EURO|nr:uncharacterized protein BO70DRAFT_399627 [Aspergillus heteromorphus CBS 117.55]PWY71014.1 hypothetical protein BO70DRAFT_399627 [Aspergillus heteromorphus CBS 117.55]
MGLISQPRTRLYQVDCGWDDILDAISPGRTCSVPQLGCPVADSLRRKELISVTSSARRHNGRRQRASLGHLMLTAIATPAVSDSLTPVDVDPPSDFGPLWQQAIREYEEITERKVIPRRRDSASIVMIPSTKAYSIHGWTALLVAAQSDQPEAISLLLRRHPNIVSQRFPSGATAVAVAAEMGSDRAVAVLLNAMDKDDSGSGLLTAEKGSRPVDS